VKKRRARISDQDFVKAWMSAETQTQVCDRLGCGQATVSNRAKRLRERGVQLPQLRHGNSYHSDVHELNSLIHDLEAAK
jgi:biotin operon repressor